MPFEAGTELAEKNHVIEREIPGSSERHVKRRSLVPSGPEDTVALRPGGIRRILVEHVKVESRGDTDDRQGTAGVPGTCGEMLTIFIARISAAAAFNCAR